MDNGGDWINPDTGELISVSDAAIAAAQVYRKPPSTNINAALMEALEKLPEWITTDKDNAGFKRDGKAIKYASLKTIIETVRPVLLESGIRIRQGSDKSWPLDDGAGAKGRLIPVYTDLIHCSSGEIDRTIIEIPLLRMDAQAMGSAITYGRRYSLLSALGLATDEADDDGETAKLKELDAEHRDSADLAAMTRDLNMFTSLPKLEDWARDGRQAKRFTSLSQEEQAILRARKAARVTALMSGDDEPKRKAKVAAE